MKIEVKMKPSATAVTMPPEKSENSSEVPVVEKPVKKPEVRKIAGKIRLSYYDILVLIAMLETVWWGMFGLFDETSLIFGQPEMGPDMRMCCRLRVLSVVLCIWYGAIAKGRTNLLSRYMVFAILCDSYLIYLNVHEIRISRNKDERKNILAFPTPVSYGIYGTLTFEIFRACIYAMIYSFILATTSQTSGDDKKEKKTSAAELETVSKKVSNDEKEEKKKTSAGKQRRASFYGKGILEVGKHYRRNVKKAALLILLFSLIWSFCMFVFNQLPKLIFNRNDVGILGSSLYFENLTNQNFHMSLALFGIFAILKKNIKVVYIWGIVVVIASYLALCEYFMTVTTYFSAPTMEFNIYSLFFFVSAEMKLLVCIAVGKLTTRKVEAAGNNGGSVV